MPRPNEIVGEGRMKMLVKHICNLELNRKDLFVALHGKMKVFSAFTVLKFGMLQSKKGSSKFENVTSFMYDNARRKHSHSEPVLHVHAIMF